MQSILSKVQTALFPPEPKTFTLNFDPKLKVDCVYACIHEVGKGKVSDIKICKEWMVVPSNGSFTLTLELALVRQTRGFQICAMRKDESGKHVSVAQLSGPSPELLSAGSCLTIPVLSR